MSQFYRVSSAIIAPDLSRDLGLNSQELGLLGAIFFYVFALVQPPLGLLLDRIGARIGAFSESDQHARCWIRFLVARVK